MWYVWMLASAIVWFVGIIAAAQKDFEFESDFGYYGFIGFNLVCVGSFFHGIMKIFGW